MYKVASESPEYSLEILIAVIKANYMPNGDPKNDISFADEEGDAAIVWESLPPEREFFATPYDPPVKALVQELRDSELIVRPSFQRNRVWDNARKSKFIESILLNIPIPNLFFAEDDDKSKVVVDGQQRLMALREFLENQYQLISLEVLAGLNGKRFLDLTERQQRIISNRTLRCLIISAKSDSEIRFQVFERLNQGGVPLNAQEVRHCVYRGRLNDLLHELAKFPAWLAVLHKDEPHNRMVDCELILRFLTLRNLLPNYRTPLKKRLNEFMRDNRHPNDDEIEDLKGAFVAALGNARVLFGDNAFRRIVLRDHGIGEYEANVNRAVFDVQMLLLEGMDPTELTAQSEVLTRTFIELCTRDEAFIDAVSRATADKARLTVRLSKWVNALEAVGLAVPHADRVPRV